MKVVLIGFVVAFLGLGGYAIHLSRQPALHCPGSKSTGYLDHTSDAIGEVTPLAAARHQMIAKGDRVVGTRETEPEGPDFTYRSYDGDRLLEIVEIRRAASGGWLATKHTRC